jgi:hypothetical protein
MGEQGVVDLLIGPQSQDGDLEGVYIKPKL